MKRALPLLLALALAPTTAPRAQDLALPILVPLTGFAALEGTSQRNGALLAAREIGDIAFKPEVLDTQTTPEGAIAAWSRAVGPGNLPPAVVGPILGTQMLALLPLAQQRGVSMLTVSGTARLSEMGNPQLFRFFPSDQVVKVAHARYVAQTLGARRPAVIFQSTAYGQSGREQLARSFAELGTPPVLEESVGPQVNDLTPALVRARAANADVLVLHLHAPSTALAVRQARQLMPSLPIVAGSAMHQPATAALLEPAELKGICAETASSPVSAISPPMRAFLDAYRAQWRGDPDAFAAAQYDSVHMLARVIRRLRAAGKPADAASVRDGLAREEWRGVAASYRSDGRGNMAHEAEIVCYDGLSRVPKLATRFSFPPG